MRHRQEEFRPRAVVRTTPTALRLAGVILAAVAASAPAEAPTDVGPADGAPVRIEMREGMPVRPGPGRVLTLPAGGSPTVMGRPPGLPSTRPSASPSAPLLPERYVILLTRSLFDRGFVSAPAPGSPGSIGGPGGPPGPMGPEAALALRGSARDNGDDVALIEDTTSHRTMRLKPGEPVGEGRIKKIDLLSIEYEWSGGSRRVEVGQNLLGMALPPTTQPGPPAGPPGQPGQGPPGAVPGQPMPPGMEMPPGVMAAPPNAPRAKRRG